MIHQLWRDRRLIHNQ